MCAVVEIGVYYGNHTKKKKKKKKMLQRSHNLIYTSLKEAAAAAEDEPEKREDEKVQEVKREKEEERKMTQDLATISFASQSRGYMNIKAQLLMDKRDETRERCRKVSEVMMRQERSKIIADASFFFFFQKLQGER